MYNSTKLLRNSRPFGLTTEASNVRHAVSCTAMASTDLSPETAAPKPDTLELLSSELTMLRMKWGLWKAMFMDDSAVKTLNKASGVAAACILDVLLKDVVLGLARMLDPKSQGGNENAALERVIEGEVPAELRSCGTRVREIRLGSIQPRKEAQGVGRVILGLIMSIKYPRQWQKNRL